MVSSPVAIFDTRAGTLGAILKGGLIAGVLDITDAFVVSGLRGISPIRVLHYIARALIGPSANQGGYATAALGLFLHFFIALTAAAVFVLASRSLPVLTRRWIVCGLAFGVAVFFFMNRIVLPLSALPPQPFPPPMSFLVNQLAIHALGIGLPIAYFAQRAARG